jgi:hypothetical protein
MRQLTILSFVVFFIVVSVSGQDFKSGIMQVPDVFNLLEPENGAHIIFTSPSENVMLRWEDVLELEGENEQDPENPDRYYLLRPGIDPNFDLAFDDEVLIEPFLAVPAYDISFVFRLMELLSGSKVDTVTVYWTIAAVNIEGTTWASDTFHVTFEIDNDPPSGDFVLLEPENDAVVEVMISGESHTPIEGDITFTWTPATDPNEDTVYYFCVMSDLFPIPDIIGILEDDNGNGDPQSIEELSIRYSMTDGLMKQKTISDEEPMFFMFPSGEFDFGTEWDLGGIETFLKIPHDIAYYWILGGMLEEKTLYWTVIASDGFGVYHWVPSGDTLEVTFKTTLTNVNELPAGIPSEYFLGQNYPNPFNPTTTIRYALPERSHVIFTVYNTLGQEIVRLVDGEVDAGMHQVVVDAFFLPSGVYIYRLQAGNYVESKKLMILR